MTGGASSHRSRRLEYGGLLLVLLAAVALRVPGFVSRAEWDSDQGGQMLALRAFVHDGIVPLLGPPASVGGFHHGALYYWLLAPAAALGGGNDPTPVLAAFVVAGLAGVLAAWWAGREMGGPLVGLVAAALTAVSAASVASSTWLWNPNLVAPAAMVAVGAAWSAVRHARPRSWAVGAIGLAIAGQGHVLAWLLGGPLLALYLSHVRAAADDRARARVLRWGGVAVLIIAASFVPLAVYDAQHGFTELRGMLAFLAGAGTGSGSALGPVARVLVVAIRMLAWPIVGLLTSAPIPAVLASVVLVASLALLAWTRGSLAWPARWTLASLAFGAVALGVGVPALAQVTPLTVDQYHAAFDPLVILGVALAVAAAARSSRPGTVVGAVALVALVGWNVVHTPPFPAPDGGWPAADAAARRVEADVGRAPFALLSLPSFKPPDAYLYPLVADGRPPVTSGTPETLVVLCDDLFVPTCGPSSAELAAQVLGPATTVDRFDPAPGRHLAVFASALATTERTPARTVTPRRLRVSA